MTRPWIIWATALVCAIIVLGSVGMMTLITLNLEKKIYVEDKKQERVEKAVVAMEAYVDSLLARENNRGADEFAPLQTRFNKNSSKGDLEVYNSLSPLFSGTPEDVNLYWCIEVGDRLNPGKFVSPQLPSWGSVAKYAPNNEARQNREVNQLKGEKLKEILTESSDTPISEEEGIQSFGYGVSNIEKASKLATCLSVHNDQRKTVRDESLKKSLQRAVSKGNTAWADLRSDSKATDQAVLEKQLRAVSRNGLHNAENDNMAPEYSNTYTYDASSNTAYQVEAKISTENPYVGQFAGAKVSPFVALWIGQELMLVRNVDTQEGQFVQGVWLDSAKIKVDLVSLAETFLPNVKMEKVVGALDMRSLTYSIDDLYGLSYLPFRIQPGELLLDVEGVSPMRLNLIIAWLCVILAVVAVSMMFKGVMKLSERRASFVSSVSHELRTPLTTFKLYSEMLAGGMVKDPEKRQGYLETLLKESDRLSHMVENVLSFSQIERGKAKRELCRSKVGNMVSQLEPCFRMRLNEEGISYANDLSDEVLNAEVEVDATSVDQILTNLIDNVAKYGQNKTSDSVARLSGEVSPKWVYLRVSDDGRGIDKSAAKRLFKAFHKSDVEAAHSKPGVGLGLALCRKLARSMGGDLVVAKAPDASSGACLELRLPRV